MGIRQRRIEQGIKILKKGGALPFPLMWSKAIYSSGDDPRVAGDFAPGRRTCM